MGGVPQPVVDYVGIFLRDAGLGSGLLLAQGHGLQCLVGRVQYDRRRTLVNLPGLDAHQPVLHMVDPTHAMPATDRVQVADQGDSPHRLAVDGDGCATLEANLDIHWLIWSFGCRSGPQVGVFRRLQPRVFQLTGLHAAAPQVLVCREAAGAGVDGQVAGQPVLDFVVPAHSPVANGSDDLQAGIEGHHAHLKPHLVVAFAGAAVGHGVGAVLTRRLHHVSRNQRTAQRRCQRVLLLVHRPRLEAGVEELVHQRLPSVHDDGLDRPDGQRPLAGRFQIDHAQVNGECDNVSAVLLLEPRHRHRGIQPAAVGEHDSVVRHLFA